MKLPTIILSIIILISCQKDISNQFIQPPKYKGENVNEVFPYVKYTSVKSYSFNKFYTIRDDSTNQALIDSLQRISDVGMDSIFKKIYYLYGEYLPKKYDIINDNKVIKEATFEKKLNKKEIEEFSKCFDLERAFTIDKNGKKRPMKPLSRTECKPNYRDALVFFNNDQPVAWVNICFECYQIKFTPEVTQKIHYYRITWNKLHDYFEVLGHDVDYHKHWR